MTARDIELHRLARGPSEIVRIVFEAAGAYHCAFARTLAMAGLPMAKINPRQARRFAEAKGQAWPKTDRRDAAMLARFGTLLEPTARPISSQTLDEMKEFHAARRALVKDRTAAFNRKKLLRSDLLKRQAAHSGSSRSPRKSRRSPRPLRLCATPTLP